MKKRSYSAIFWGLIFIAIAAYIVLDVLGITAGIGLWSAILIILAAVVLIKSIRPLNFFGILFPIAFAGIILDSQLGIEAFTPWPILGIALFLSIGFSIIFKKGFKFNVYNGSNVHVSKGAKNVHVSGEGVHVDANGKNIHIDPSGVHVEDANGNEEFKSEGGYKEGKYEQDSVWNIEGGLGKKITYITSQNLKVVNLEFGLGELQVYFTDAKMQGDSIVVNAEVGMGRAVMYFPKEWDVQIVSQEVFGSLNEQEHTAPEGAPIVYLNLDVGMGQVDIQYV